MEDAKDFLFSPFLAAPSPVSWRRQSTKPPTRSTERLWIRIVAFPTFSWPTREGEGRLGHRRRRQKAYASSNIFIISFTSVSDLRHFETKPDLLVSSTVRYLQKIRFLEVFFCLSLTDGAFTVHQSYQVIMKSQTVDIKVFCKSF